MQHFLWMIFIIHYLALHIAIWCRVHTTSNVSCALTFNWDNSSWVRIPLHTVVNKHTAFFNPFRNPVNTSYTTMFHTRSIYFPAPHIVFMYLVWIWEQTAIISLYNINWLVCITEKGCVYCAARTGSLYTILRSAHHSVFVYLCGSENKQRLFPYTALTDWFV